MKQDEENTDHKLKDCVKCDRIKARHICHIRKL